MVTSLWPALSRGAASRRRFCVSYPTTVSSGELPSLVRDNYQSADLSR